MQINDGTEIMLHDGIGRGAIMAFMLQGGAVKSTFYCEKSTSE